MSKKSESIKLFTKRSSDPDDLTDEVYKIFKELFCKLSQIIEEGILPNSFYDISIAWIQYHYQY